jgi:hypothetical protein
LADLIRDAARRLTPEQRARMTFELLMENLRTIGGLKNK